MKQSLLLLLILCMLPCSGAVLVEKTAVLGFPSSTHLDTGNDGLRLQSEYAQGGAQPLYLEAERATTSALRARYQQAEDTCAALVAEGERAKTTHLEMQADLASAEQRIADLERGLTDTEALLQSERDRKSVSSGFAFPNPFSTVRSEVADSQTT
jgi:hypothetical protein